jgi:phytoene dehydrogenase-like protein
MARIVVIGGGLGGLASAARLAKLGHAVTLLEASRHLGGAMRTVASDGYTWSAGPVATSLPAVLRDLFRKTGRPMDAEVDLVQVDPIRRHRFPDGSTVAVPGGSRASQLAAFEQLAVGSGRAWCDHVAAYADTWEVLRRDYLERPYDPAVASTQLRRLLASRESLSDRVRTTLPDPRLRAVATWPVLLEGHDVRRVPAWVGVDAYLGQRFGNWTLEGGFPGLAAKLGDRLATRGVRVLTHTPADDLIVRQGRVVAVATAQGDLDCDLAVCAIDPHVLPELARHVRRTRTTTQPRVCHVAVSGPPPLESGETVFHGDGWVAVRASPDSPTLSVMTRAPGDPVDLLAQHGLELRDRILARVDEDPSGGSAYAVLWRGRGTVRRRLGPTTPIRGVYAAGAHANPGAGIPFVGLSAALVAQAIGPA